MRGKSVTDFHHKQFFFQNSQKSLQARKQIPGVFASSIALSVPKYSSKLRYACSSAREDHLLHHSKVGKHHQLS